MKKFLNHFFTQRRFVDIFLLYGYITFYAQLKHTTKVMAPVGLNKDEQKRAIGEYLKAADKFIKSAEFPKALEQVNKALALEPNNMYALAYNERIKVATEAAQKKEAEDRMKKVFDERKSSAPAPSHNFPNAMPSTAPAPTPASSSQLPADGLQTKSKTEAQKDVQQDVKTEQQPAAASPASADYLKILFVKAWEDGTISTEERALLETLKSALDVSDSMFAALENEAKGLLYRNALRKVWHDGVITPEEADELAQLREKFNIPAEDHFKYEAELRKELQKK